MATVFTAHVRTESSDHYVWVFSKKPTREQVIERLMEHEGADPEDDRDFYMNTTSVTIEQARSVDF